MTRWPPTDHRQTFTEFLRCVKERNKFGKHVNRLWFPRTQLKFTITTQANDRLAIETPSDGLRRLNLEASKSNESFLQGLRNGSRVPETTSLNRKRPNRLFPVRRLRQDERHPDAFGSK
ncbi:hypothetical protein F2P81_018084 [Scophthalmus maximus]|uniref:Uncharacterized protein n=1 Tax=Scophthalmus maximus TaxID=52904 RepID=A0A6A4S8U8_SCOMX|nr:hypothetical protein F2P81_018084 [Scophthalmus maximus]